MKKIRKVKIGNRLARKDAERSKRLVNAQDKLINVERMSWQDAKDFHMTAYMQDYAGNHRAVKSMKLGELVNVDLLTSLPKPIVVTPRQKGMTSTGQVGDCHANVKELVMKYGGKQITGYELWKYGDEVQMNWHSVWQTPENKIVDVTNLSDDVTLKQMPRTEEYIFIPMCYAQDNFFAVTHANLPVLKKDKCILKVRSRDDVVERVVETFEGKNQITMSFFSNIHFVFDSMMNHVTSKNADSQFLKVA